MVSRIMIVIASVEKIVSEWGESDWPGSGGCKELKII